MFSALDSDNATFTRRLMGAVPASRSSSATSNEGERQSRSYLGGHLPVFGFVDARLRRRREGEVEFQIEAGSMWVGASSCMEGECAIEETTTVPRSPARRKTQPTAEPPPSSIFVPAKKCVSGHV